MNKRSFFKKALLSLGAMGLLPASVNAQSKKYMKGKFIHMVYFWFNEGTDIDAFISKTETFLKQVPEVKGYHIGQPAGTPREIVDNSYSVSLVVTFDSKEDQDAYQKHPVHVEYAESIQSLISSIKIYDSWSSL
ncbi:MAG: Dabb family protein [Marinoscillum sp.]